MSYKTILYTNVVREPKEHLSMVTDIPGWFNNYNLFEFVPDVI